MKLGGMFGLMRKRLQSCKEYFQSILGTHQHRSTTINWDDIQLPRLPDQSQLDRQFTEEEIRLAVADLPVEKAPGLDGFTGMFY
jgi:hypothetical protein